MSTQDVALLADIGGTNMRFAIAHGGTLSLVEVCPWPEKPSLVKPAQEYMQRHRVKPQRAVFACASAQPGIEQVRMVNVGDHDDLYTFSVSEVRKTLGLEQLVMLNDFAAVALAVPQLDDQHVVKIGSGQSVAGRPIGVLGAGTGLGCASLVFVDGAYHVVSGEGGHVTIGGTNRRECALIDWLHIRFPHVSAERVLSGPGLVNLHDAIRAVDGLPATAITPADILKLGLGNTDAICREAIEVFCSLLGSVAGNLALVLAATGGIYIGGGIPPRMADFIAASAFRERFAAKGRYRSFLEAIPTYVITHPEPGLLGTLAALRKAD